MASPSPLSLPAPRPRAVRVLPPPHPLPLPPLFGYSNPLSLSFSLLFAEEGSLRRYSLLPLRPTGRMIAPKGPSRARRAFSTYMRVTAFHPPVCQEEGRGREGGRGREKDSRLEIRSIGLIGLRRHGLAARAPPIARTTREEDMICCRTFVHTCDKNDARLVLDDGEEDDARSRSI